MTNNILDSLVYYDVGAINGRSFPFNDGENDQYLKRWVGFDPNFEEEYKVDGKNIYYGYAVSDVEGTVKYYISNRNINNSLFVANKEKFIGIHGRQMVLPKREKDIRCRMMENVIFENNGEIDILKIDAHGSEYPILIGTGKYLKDIIIIHVEIWNEDWYIGAKKGIETFEYLLNNGFIPKVCLEKSKGEWADIVFLNTNSHGYKCDLCKSIYQLKQDDIFAELKNDMGWSL